MPLILVVGGIRSGKSEVAERLATAAGQPVCYLATGSADDPEMAERIGRHRRRRPAGWRTVECDDPTVATVAAHETLLVDGVALWLARLMREGGLWTDEAVAPLGTEGRASHERAVAAVRAFAQAAAARPGLTVVVAEESGLGLLPHGAGPRRYLDLAGEALQALARSAKRVLLVLAGRTTDLAGVADHTGVAEPAERASDFGLGADHAGVAEPADPATDSAGVAEPAGRATDPGLGVDRADPATGLARVAEPAGGAKLGGEGRGAGGLAPPWLDTPERAAPAADALTDGRVPAELRLHGDTMVAGGQLDFAVNVVPGGPPGWLRDELASAIRRAGAYPDDREAVVALAERHGRAPEEVLPTNGSAEAFWLIASAFRPLRAVVVHPSFTEPEAALRARGHPVERVFRQQRDFTLDPSAVPASADLVVLGNPNNPTGTLDPAELAAALVRPGRLVVVDEAFMELVPGEPESLAACRELPGLVVVRSLTKAWGLAGVRAGYLLAAAEVVGSLRAARQPWSVNGPACAALAAWARRTSASGGRSPSGMVARRVAAARAELAAGLAALPGVRVWPSVVNFLLIQVPDGPAAHAGLGRRGIAVRPAHTFPGLTANHLRLAVRDPPDNRRLVEALGAVLEESRAQDSRAAPENRGPPENRTAAENRGALDNHTAAEHRAPDSHAAPENRRASENRAPNSRAAPSAPVAPERRG
jgi:histidinol-phosphate/aromatic aminotransferase/cobyric acid decarboxylase-like protein/adenosyl cobinamide kinase/adenosyl cobinamide phosphate guanylyltransferase